MIVQYNVYLLSYPVMGSIEKQIQFTSIQFNSIQFNSMAEELNMQSKSVFTKADTSSLPVPDTKINGSEGGMLGQLVATPEVVATNINSMREIINK